MPISLPKTLQGVQYDLHALISIQTFSSSSVYVQEKIYQSLGHYEDDFQPMIVRREVITNQDVMDVVNNLININVPVVMQAIENYLVNAVSYFSGGTVVS